MPNRNVAWMLVLVLIALMFWRLPPIIAQRDIIYTTFLPMVAVRNQIQQHYVQPIDDHALLEGALEGMISRLDRFSAYIPPAEYGDFKKRTEGVFSGIGIEIEAPEHVLTVISPIEDTPAFRAGVLAGDQIVAIDAVPTKNMSIDEAVKRISGKAGTDVTLSLLHPGESEAVDVTIRRAPITIKTVRGWMRNETGGWDYRIDPQFKIDYIRINSFIENTASEFTSALTRALNRGADGLILDLRSNPGGLLEAAVDVVDCFLSEGLIVMTRGRQGNEERYQARRQTFSTDIPIVVLVDGGSASASEIVAGALQDRKRAVIIGERTYGKGSVQNVIEIDSGRSAIKLTTAYYYLPLGRRIHRARPGQKNFDWTRESQKQDQTDQENLWGVKPDIGVAISDQRAKMVRHARSLYGVVRSNGPATGPASRPTASQPDRDTIRKMLMDEQIEEAIKILRKQIRESHGPPDIAVKPAA